MLTAAFAAIALLAAADSAAEPAAKPTAEAPAKKVCKRQEEVSGSRLAKRVCVTVKPKAQAEAPETAAADQPAG